MPHYKDGTPAEVGDLVKGKPYNTPREVVGTLVQITEGVESCNCVVAFADVQAPVGIVPTSGGPTVFKRVIGGRVVQGVQSYLEDILIRGTYDYGELRAFERIAPAEA